VVVLRVSDIATLAAGQIVDTLLLRLRLRYTEDLSVNFPTVGKF
jgi:hypothetical protein